MKKSTTSATVVPAAIIEEAWQEVGASFERFCLTAGIATLAAMMEEDAGQPGVEIRPERFSIRP
jgi:hypothetical protein